MKPTILIVAAALTVIGSGAMAQSKFGASARWCGSSPEFKLSGVRKGTTKLDLKMVDLDVPSCPHGGAQVSYQGQKAVECSEISQASFGRYQGPSPPSGQ